MKKFYVYIELFTLITAMCLGLIGCSNEPQDSATLDSTLMTNLVPSNTEIYSQDYSLIEQAGNNYMVFDDMTLYDGPNDRADLEFESLAEFKDTVITGKLTDWQKTVIATAFKKDDNGVRICDFNNLLEPHMPNECKIRAVYWSGESYSFDIYTSSGVFGVILNLPQSIYNEMFNRDFEYIFNDTTIKVKETYETDDGKKSTVYTTSKGDSLRYIISTTVYGEKNIVVKEEYRSSSNTVPNNIEMYCIDSDSFYVVKLYGLVEKPSDAWLYEFSMEKVE